MSSYVHTSSLEPEANFTYFVERGTRPNGRALPAVRPLSIEVRPLDKSDGLAGSAMATLGATRVLGTVSLQIGTPNVFAPREGDLLVKLSLAPFDGGPGGGGANAEQRQRAEEATVTGEAIQGCLLDAGSVVLEDLCIDEGRAAWALGLHLVCLNDDGAVLDCAMAAATATLRTCRLPNTVPDDRGLRRVVDEPWEDRTPLPVRHSVASLTCGVWRRYGIEYYDGDSSSEEEEEEEEGNEEGGGGGSGGSGGSSGGGGSGSGGGSGGGGGEGTGPQLRQWRNKEGEEEEEQLGKGRRRRTRRTSWRWRTATRARRRCWAA